MNFEMEAKYPLSIFTKNNIPYSWSTVKVGWDLKRISSEEISKFALDYFEQHPELVNKYISELVFGVKEHELNNYLENVFQSLNLPYPQKKSSLWNKEWIKWRYCIMNAMYKNEKLLDKIDEIYADFGYPDDMRHLTSFDPLDPKDYNLKPDQLKAKMVKNIRYFLEDQKDKINQGIDVLPHRVIEYESTDKD